MGAVLCCETRDAGAQAKQQKKNSKRKRKEMMEDDETPSQPGEESSQYFTHRDGLEMRDTKRKQSVKKNSDGNRSSSYEEDGVFPPSKKQQDSDSESEEEFIFPGMLSPGKGSSVSALEQQERVSALQGALDGAGQGHLLQFFDQLNDDEKENLMSQLVSINPVACNQLYNSQMVIEEEDDEGSLAASSVDIANFETIGPQFIIAPTLAERDTYAKSGNDLIRNGKVAMCLIATESAKNLGSSEVSKGFFQMDLPSGKTVFQIFVEKFLRVQQIAHGSKKITKNTKNCKMMIITSQSNYSATKAFFKENNYFGAGRTSFLFHTQGMLPQVDLDGKIIMKRTSEIQLSPSGSGALFESVSNSQKVKDLLKSVDYLQVSSIENMTCLDPVFVGYSSQKGLQGCVKAYERTKASETPSVIVKKNGKYDILDYDQLIDNDMHSQKQDNKFVYNLADMQEYLLKSDVLLRICADIQDLNKLYRKSFKKIETYDEEEECTVKPDNANGYQFELYINSFFQFCDEDKFGVIQQEKVPTLKSASDVQQVKDHIMKIGKAYCDEVLENKSKFKGKQVEINFLKTLGEHDTKDAKYKQAIELYLPGLSTKDEFYIE